MSFKGCFTRIISHRQAGNIIVSFSLTCTNSFLGEKVDVALYPSDNSHPWFFRDLEFKAGQTYFFNFDTVDWDWYQDDYAAIIDKEGNIRQKWIFHMMEYGPGECPDCHGTKKCKKCNGTGFLSPPGQLWNFTTCPMCGGTGVCITCEIPRRKPQMGGGPLGLHPF